MTLWDAETVRHLAGRYVSGRHGPLAEKNAPRPYVSESSEQRLREESAQRDLAAILSMGRPA